MGDHSDQPRHFRVTDETGAERENREMERDLRTSILVRGAVAEAVTEAVRLHMPSKEEREWIELAMKREARRERLQEAIIDKSLTGLALGLGGWLLFVIGEYVKTHFGRN